MGEATGYCPAFSLTNNLFGKLQHYYRPDEPFCLNMTSANLNLKETQQTMQETYCQCFQGCPCSVGPVGPRFWIHSGGGEKRNASAVSVQAADCNGQEFKAKNSLWFVKVKVY